MQFVLVCLIFWSTLSEGFLEDKFLLVFSNDDPAIYKQIDLQGRETTLWETIEHELPHLMTVKANGKGVIVKCYSTQQVLLLNWDSGTTVFNKVTMTDLLLVSGITVHEKDDYVFLTYYNNAEIIKRSLAGGDGSRKTFANNWIPLNADSYAYNGTIWFLAFSGHEKTSLVKYEIATEKRTIVAELSKSFDLIRYDVTENKVYLVFLSEIYVTSVDKVDVKILVKLDTYIEDFVVGDDYLYVILSMKDVIYTVDKVTKATSFIEGDKNLRRPRKLELFQKSRFHAKP